MELQLFTSWRCSTPCAAAGSDVLCLNLLLLAEVGVPRLLAPLWALLHGNAGRVDLGAIKGQCLQHWL